MTAGVHGYILKDSPFEVLLRAIRSEGPAYQHSELPLQAIGKQAAQTGDMTARERQVLIGIALGYSNKRIAGNLGRSVKTIEKHRFKMMHRLGLRNAAAATRYAINNGLVHDDDGAREPAPERASAEAAERTARSPRRARP
jgi:two-component system nitrate/nitrite response regulator NarL